MSYDTPDGFSQAAYDTAHTLPAQCEDCAASKHGCPLRPDECGGQREKVCGDCGFWWDWCGNTEADVLAERMDVTATTDAEECEGWEAR
jgi:hypothetical protein